MHKDVVAAFEKEMEKDEYRRLKWAHALLKSMENDSEELSVLFWGY